MSRIVVAGIVTVRLAHQVDSFPVGLAATGHGRLSVQLGGTGWTAATTLHALGADLAFATFVGSDPLGLVAAEGLRAKGWLGPAALVCAEQPRGLVLYDRAGGRYGISDVRSTWDFDYPTAVFKALLTQGCDIVLMSSVGFTRPLVEVVVDRGVPMATDVHLIRDVEYPRKQAWMRTAATLACSHEQLPHGPYEWIESVWRRYATPFVLVGCGGDGVVLGVHRDRAIWHVPAAVPRGVRFTSGAGDTLLAAFVYHHVTGGDPVAAARLAAFAAGWKVGGSPDEEFGLSHGELVEVADVHGLPPAQRMR
jgi:acarbose 7IV-phosphotransferase